MASVRVDQLIIPNEETAIPLLRHDQYLVSSYAAAMRQYGGWGDFPEGIMDQDNLVLAGVHRVLAAMEAGVARAKMRRVRCETPAERLLIAAGDNSTHGQRWERKDIVRVSLVAERFGVSREDLAEKLRVPVSTIERIPVTTVVRKTVEGAPQEERVYSKKAVRPFLKDRTLSEAEEEIMLRITTPNRADQLLDDLIRLYQLDALPELNPESHRQLGLVQQILAEWEARDRHILEAV